MRRGKGSVCVCVCVGGGGCASRESEAEKKESRTKNQTHSMEAATPLYMGACMKKRATAPTLPTAINET